MVTPAGVWVVDTKRYAGKAPEKRVEGGSFSPRVEKLYARGDKTRLVDGVLRQVAVLTEALGDVPVRGVLCFIDAEWPLFASPFTVNGVSVTWPGKLVTAIVSGSEGSVDVAAVSATISTRFRAA